MYVVVSEGTPSESNKTLRTPFSFVPNKIESFEIAKEIIFFSDLVSIL